MKFLITPLISTFFFVTFTTSIAIFSLNASSDATSDIIFQLPSEESQLSKPDLYVCLIFPMCGDPDDASPIIMPAAQLDSQQLPQQV